MRTFISYSTTDRILAGEVKESLEDFGFSTFLAHDDIKPTQPWVERILDELNKSDIFFPLLTDNFHKSVWTSQEVGIAVGRGTFVVSLKVDVDPEGFLARFQALKLRPTNLKKSAFEIAHLVSEEASLRRLFLNDLISLYEASRSFDQAAYRSSQLNLFEGYTPSQVNAVLQAAINNNQIYLSWGSDKELDKFIHTHREIVNKNFVRSYHAKRSGNAG